MKVQEFVDAFEAAKQDPNFKYYRQPEIGDWYFYEGYVHEEFEEGGRWQNIRTHVFKMDDGFVAVTMEEAATENQEDNWDDSSAYQVYPKEKTVVVYEETP